MKAMLARGLDHFPGLKSRLRRWRDRLFPGKAVSADYVALQGEAAMEQGQALRQSWQDDTLPDKQWELVEKQLQRLRRGLPVDVFDVFIQALRVLPASHRQQSLLEIGCSSGFYSEVLRIAGLNLRYSGCDYSSAFIAMAHQRYPGNTFTVEDATALQQADDSHDIVVSGCCLLHIPQYAQAVAEAARVARSHVMFHRTPVVWGQKETWYRKKAYGIDTVEIHFNEDEFLELLQAHGLELIATYTLSESAHRRDSPQGQAVRTYLCRKLTH